MKYKLKEEKINKLRMQISKCTRCSLHADRTNTVSGEGDVDADIMFIGEAPGKNEDLKGKPFIGRAGNIFENLLNSIELTREDIYLCNILKCRPPKNRNPSACEIEQCVKFLDKQIEIVDPKVIGTLGTFSTNYIFEKFGLPFAKISAVAGKMFDIQTPSGLKKIIPVFHPAVAIYNVHKTDQLMEGFQIFKQFTKVKSLI